MRKFALLSFLAFISFNSPGTYAADGVDFTRCIGAASSAFGFTNTNTDFLKHGIVGMFDAHGKLNIQKNHPDLISASDDKIILKTGEYLLDTNKQVDGRRTVIIKKDSEGRIVSISYDLGDEALAKSMSNFDKKNPGYYNSRKFLLDLETTFRYKDGACEVDQMVAKQAKDFDNLKDTEIGVTYDRDLCKKILAIEKTIPEHDKAVCDNYLSQISGAISSRQDALKADGKKFFSGGIGSMTESNGNPLLMWMAVRYTCKTNQLGPFQPDIPSVDDPVKGGFPGATKAE